MFLHGFFGCVFFLSFALLTPHYSPSLQGWFVLVFFWLQMRPVPTHIINLLFKSLALTSLLCQRIKCCLTIQSASLREALCSPSLVLFTLQFFSNILSFCLGRFPSALFWTFLQPASSLSSVPALT